MTPDAVRESVLAIARAEDGSGDEYRYTVPELGYRTAGHLSWCGLFALWCYRRAGLARDAERWVLGQGFASRYLRQIDPAAALPGDLMYYRQYQHHAILEARDGAATWTIDGNGPGGIVVRRRRPLADAAAAYSIAHWVARALADPIVVVTPPTDADPAPAPTAPHELQRALAAAGYPPGPVDGVIGPRTRAALESWALTHPERVT